MIIPFIFYTALATVLAVDITSDPDLVAKIKSAATHLDRHKLIDNSPQGWRFVFTDAKNYTFDPGSVINANVATWPAMTGVGMTIAMLYLGPCAMLAPHSHPRATNVVVAVDGDTTTWMVEENGADVVSTDLKPGQMTIFPAGSLHAMQNNDCHKNATLVSALNSEDTGTLNHLNALFQLQGDIVTAAFGSENTMNTQAWGKNIPGVGTGVVKGMKSCYDTCARTRDPPRS